MRVSAETWMAKTSAKQNRGMICINDSEEPTDFEDTLIKFRDDSEAILPGKCSFEK